MRVCYSLLLLLRRRTALLLFSSRLLNKRTRKNTHMRDHIVIELKREMKSLRLMTRRPLLCAQNAQKDASSKSNRKKREDETLCRPPRGRREHITAALFFEYVCLL